MHGLGPHLIGAAALRHDGREDDLSDGQVLDGEILVGERLIEIGGKADRIVVADRELDFRSPDPRLGEADLTRQQRRETDLGLDERKVQRRLVGLSADAQPIDAQLRRGEKPDGDPSFGPRVETERPADRPVPPMCGSSPKPRGAGPPGPRRGSG